MGLLEKVHAFCNQLRKKPENSWGGDPLPGSLVSAPNETATPPLVTTCIENSGLLSQWNKNYVYSYFVLRLIIKSR